MSRLAWIPLLALVACDGGGDTHDHDHGCDDCNLETMGTTDDGSFYVMYSLADEIVVNEDFDVTVMVHDGTDQTTLLAEATVEVDGYMPAHGHGMNVEPTVTANGDGSSTVEGMRFHMPGHWEMIVSVTEGETTEDVVFDFVLDQ